MAVRTWDYIIIGAGSAGCVLANRLSADPKCSVLVLEAGGWDWSPVISVPAGEEKAISTPDYRWAYRTEPDASRDGRAEDWPAGRLLGGSSSINGMIYLRGNRGDYDQWAQMGARGWSYDDVLPYFRRAETNSRGSDTWRGGDGPLSVADVRTPHPLAETFMAAAEEVGLARNPDVNGATQDGVGPMQATQKRGWRHSAARAYLWPALTRSNLSVRTRTTVNRILFDQNGRVSRACGVEIEQRGRIERIFARNVILSAGALASPRLLMLSGIGPASHLSEHGIPVVADLPGVGKNLQEHPGVMLSSEVSVRTYNVETDWRSVIRHGLNWIFRGRGPGATPIGHAVAFARTKEGLAYPDVQLCFTPIGYNSVGDGPLFHPNPAIVIAVNVCRPEARGSLRLRSSDPGALPLIELEMLGCDADRVALRNGARIARSILRTRAFAPVMGRALKPDDDVDSDADWDAFLRRETMRFSHPAGTCRMGTDPLAVVDPKLRVHGTSHLFVADASVMPTLPSANTNAAAIMIGEKASDLVADAATKWGEF